MPRRPAASARRSCSSASGSARSPTRARARSRAGSASAWRWRGRWRAARGRCCSTSRCRRSTPARAPRPGRELGGVLREAGVPALLVTHDFTEAALLGDEVAVRRRRADRPARRGRAARRRAGLGVRGRLHRRGRPDRLRAPGRGQRHAGRARRRRGGDGARPRGGAGGGERLPVGDHARARARAPTPARRATTCRSRSSRSPRSATACGSGWRAPQPLTAELTDAAVRELDLRPGSRAVASWKAAATRLLPLTAHQTVSDKQLVKQRLGGQRGRHGHERAPAGAPARAPRRGTRTARRRARSARSRPS